MKRLVYLNGRLIPEDEAKVSIFDRGFLYGDGLFETMRAYAGKIFRLEKHLQRLFRSAELISLPLSGGEEGLKEAVYRTLKANNLKEAYLRLTISRGQAGRGPDIADYLPPNIIITARPLALCPRKWYEEGVKAVVVKVGRDETSVLSRIKSLNYLPSILARLEARNKGADEGLMLNRQGHLAEGAASNIFLVLNGKLVTPSRESGILPGITRGAILELAPQAGGLKISEREIKRAELREAEEAFLTNSLREVVPLTRVEGHPIGAGRPGKITKTLAGAYSRLVERETNRTQINAEK